MSKEDQTVRIRYEYKEAPDIEMHYTHGVLGRINPHGELELNFYTEHDKLPVASEQIMQPNGQVSSEDIFYENQANTIIRSIHSKILLTPSGAAAVSNWLLEKLNVFQETNAQPTNSPNTKK